MTKAELYTFVTSLNDGYQMGTSLFDTFLNIAQMRRENQRPWMILRSVDTSNSITGANTFLTANTLPTDFRKWYSATPIALVNAQGDIQQRCSEVQINDRNSYKGFLDKFYCDYGNSQFFMCGTPSQSFTLNLFYIKKSTLVSSADGNEWIFPSEYHPILGLDVSVMWKLGVDYDVINNAQGNANAGLANAIFEQMTEWDSDLQNSSLQGRDYPPPTHGGFTQLGGRV